MTEWSFVGFDTARSGATAADPLGVPGMNESTSTAARLALRGTSQDELLTRLDKDRAEMLAIRVTGNNGGDTRVSVTEAGLALEPGDVSDLPVVLEFDAASFVLTAMGRANAGTARGDTAIAERFGNLFFRI